MCAMTHHIGICLCLQGLYCVYPPNQKFDVVEVTEHDLARLDDEEFLNDTVIDFFIK